MFFQDNFLSGCRQFWGRFRERRGRWKEFEQLYSVPAWNLTNCEIRLTFAVPEGSHKRHVGVNISRFSIRDVRWIGKEDFFPSIFFSGILTPSSLINEYYIHMTRAQISKEFQTQFASSTGLDLIDLIIPDINSNRIYQDNESSGSIHNVFSNHKSLNTHQQREVRHGRWPSARWTLGIRRHRHRVPEHI